METIILIGNLTEDAISRNKDGKEYLTFTIAVDDKRNKLQTRYYSCILYGANENRKKFLKKGSKINVIGEFTPSIYHPLGKDPALNLDVKVDILEFLYVAK